MKVAVQGTAKRIYNACVLQPNAYLARRSKAVRYDLRTILCGSFHKHLAGLQSLGLHSDVNLCIYNHRTQPFGEATKKKEKIGDEISVQKF